MCELKNSIARRVGSSKVTMPFSRSCGKTHVCKRHARRRPEVARREPRHADVVQPRRDRHRLLPVRHAPAIAQVESLPPAGRWPPPGSAPARSPGTRWSPCRTDDRWWAATGAPGSGQFQLKKVRSPNLFLAMCRPLPATPRYFTVNWRRSPALGARGQGDRQPVGRVRKLERRAAGRDLADGHPLAVLHAGEVERPPGSRRR